MKVLLIEDEEILGDVLKEKLEQEKFTVEWATDGEAGMAKVKPFSPDLIVLDLILPKKDGFTVLKELKADPKFKTIPVVVLSNLGQDEEIKKALALGAVDYMVKAQHPINEVIEKIKKQLVKGK